MPHVEAGEFRQPLAPVQVVGRGNTPSVAGYFAAGVIAVATWVVLVAVAGAGDPAKLASRGFAAAVAVGVAVVAGIPLTAALHVILRDVTSQTVHVLAFVGLGLAVGASVLAFLFGISWNVDLWRQVTFVGVSTGLGRAVVIVSLHRTSSASLPATDPRQ